MGFEIPVDVDYFDHPKTRALVARIGPDADIFPLRLWKWATLYSKKGVVGPDPLATEVEIGWVGSGRHKGRLLLELIRVGFVDLAGPDGTVYTGEEAVQKTLDDGLLVPFSPLPHRNKQPTNSRQTVAKLVLNSQQKVIKKTPKTDQNICLSTLVIHDWMGHIGRAIYFYEEKKRKQREKYARRLEILPEDLPEEFQKNSGRLPPILNKIYPPKKGGIVFRNSSGRIPEPPPVSREGEGDDGELTKTLGAFEFCLTPDRAAKEKTILDLKRQGLTHERMRSVAARHPNADFYDIVRILRHSKNGNGTVPFAPAPSQPPKKVAQAAVPKDSRRDEAVRLAREKLREVPTDEISRWRAAVLQDPQTDKLKGALLDKYVESKILSRVAQKFGIEGM